ncbi:hypothetical protein BH10BDE1_BH10BDE1_00210 [soil metagenome]
MKNSVLALAIMVLSVTACGTKGGGTAAVIDTKSDTTTVEGATPNSDGSSSKLLKAPTEQFGDMDATPAKQEPEKKQDPKPEPKPEPKPAPKDLPPADPKSALHDTEVLEISVFAEAPLKVKPSSSGNDKIIVSLSGKLAVGKTVPTVANPIVFLAGVEEGAVITPDMGSCKLLAKNFDMRDAGKTVVFTLMGMDPKDAPLADGCLVKLSTMSMAGFTVEFKNVRLGGPLSETYVPTVRLLVSPVKSN